MKRAGSPLITIVKLDNEVSEDFCIEFLKEEYNNTFDTHLIYETGKLEELIRNNANKKVFCFISYTEFINNKFYYTNERQIDLIFIPFKDKDMYEVFKQNDYPPNIFYHYNPEILNQKLIEEKQKFMRKLNGFEGIISLL